MAECFTCLDNLTTEEIIRLITVSSGDTVSFRIKEVLFYENCSECGKYYSIDEMIRKAIWCDENGLLYLQVTKNLTGRITITKIIQ
jgi:hypothetical protein